MNYLLNVPDLNLFHSGEIRLVWPFCMEKNTMDDLMDEVDKRANLAFSNHMEMLTFFLSDEQQYGINVFKIIEVVETPKRITKIPQSHEAIVGAFNFREQLVTIIDLSLGLGLVPVDWKNSISYVIVCEYSNTTQGFLVTHPNRLLNVSWEDVKKMDASIQNSGYLTALTYDDADDAIQILDVEKILGEIIGIDTEVSQALIDEGRTMDNDNLKVMVLDDSKAARNMLQHALDQLDIEVDLFEEGHVALQALEDSLQNKTPPYCLIICDIEMPGMDGFTFTRTVKAHPELSKIHLVLHSSMSNAANKVKAKTVGADDFVPKFQPQVIARMVLDKMRLAKDNQHCKELQS